MPWEDRPGGRYYYRARKTNGRVIKEYVGSGPAAEAAAAEDARAREERDAQRQANHDLLAALDLQWVGPMEELNTIDTYCDTLVAGVLLAAGYHQHNRGDWRKRRTPSTSQTAAASSSIETLPRKQVLMPDTGKEEMADLLRRSKNGDGVASECLSSLVQDSPEFWDLVTDLARQAKTNWIALVSRLADDGASARQVLERRLGQLQSDLATQGNSRAEALLIDRILIAWIAAYYSDITLAQDMEQGRTTQELEYLERQQERTQRILLRAAQSLATLRRLRPSALEFRAGEPEICVAG